MRTIAPFVLSVLIGIIGTLLLWMFIDLRSKSDIVKDASVTREKYDEHVSNTDNRFSEAQLDREAIRREMQREAEIRAYYEARERDNLQEEIYQNRAQIELNRE